MYLERLEINGFKSFAKKSELTFPAAITAIVGPNGSGKSNVAEALRFVLGEQSVKSLRGKRGEDLIWGGSEQTSRSNRASVSVTINNEKRTLPIDTDVVTVTRIVHRDGQNEYLLNDKNVRLKDVHELLAAGNIGPSGHHIISQGEADRVLAASPTERRNMIEEALGLKVYQYKKGDAEKKLNKTQQNLQEIHGLRKEIAPHLAYLERELKKQAEARELRQTLQTTYAEYLKREDHYLAAESDRVTTELKSLEHQIETVVAAIKQHEAVTKIQPTNASVNQEKETELQSRWQTARQTREGLSQKLTAAKARLTAITEQHTALEQSAATEVVISEATLQAVVKEVEAEAATAEEATQISAVQKIVQRITKHLQSFLDSLRDDTAAKERLEALAAQQVELKQEIDTLEEEVVEATTVEEEAKIAVTTHQQEQQAAVQVEQTATKELYEQKTTLSELRANEQRLKYEQELMERERQLFKDELQEAVALLGREAARYFDYTIVDDDAKEISVALLVAEDRDKQRQRKRDLEKQKIRLETLGEGVSEDVEKEYSDTKERDDFLAREIGDLESSVATLRELIEDLNAQIEEQFRAGFGQINKEFQNFFALMFGGGTATLEEVSLGEKSDEDDIETAKETIQKGVDLQLQLPNKRIQGLAMLSGGERALTSIALIFAMSQVHPPLFVVLDETDAALDEANSRRYGDLIEALAARSQLLLITHNRETMSRAGVLYGVTMSENGTSKLLSVQLDEAVGNAK